MESKIGHNSGVLKKAAEKAQMGLAMVHKGEEDVIEGWLEYGSALNEGRELFPKGDNERFSVWLATNNLSVANDAERAAAMWAAANPNEFRQTKEDNPKVRTVRGLHSKWKEVQEEKAKDDESDNEQDGETDDDVVDTGDNSSNTPDTSEGDNHGNDVIPDHKTPKEAARDSCPQTDEKRDKINNSVAPNVVDLGAIAKDSRNTDIRKVGPAFIALMETLCTKFDRRDIERELVGFMEPDPLGLKTEALHKMANILNDLRNDYPVSKLKNLN